MADNLVIAKKDRAVIRSAVDKFIKQIQETLENPDPDFFELEVILEQLNEASTELKKIDLDIKKLVKDNQLDTELQSAEEYREKIITWRFKANRKLKENKKLENPSDLLKENFESKNETIQIKLPKLEIRKFSGNSAEWLSFWSTFENAIHENKNLDPVDKFNYLQSYLTGDALKCIEGFAITSENYFKCVDLITQRFGKKEVLIDTHMNNLLNIHPVKSSNDVKSLRKLYDKLQTQIRSLETLNINLSSYGNLLNPIILKLLPKELMLEFHKEYINKSFTVDDLLSFLFIQLSARERLQIRSETEHDYSPRLSSAKNYFKADGTPIISYPPPAVFPTRIASASNLLNKTNKPGMIDKQSCSFCEKGHDSNTCFQTMNLPFEKKLDILRKKGICYRCLKISNHIGRYCDSNIICSYCNGKHADIMCNRKREKNEITQNENRNNSNQALTNGNKSSNVYLQTLIAEIRGNKSSALIRILLDSGSQNTYVSRFVANKLNLKKIKTEKIKHGLFGGIELTEEHSRYKFNLSSLDKTYNFEIEALDQNKICTGVNHVTDEKLIKSLERENVFLSDVCQKGNLCLFEDNPEEVHLLIGADMAAHLFTQNIKYFPHLGLTAFQTKLGWVIMGKNQVSNVNNIYKNDSISSLSLSMHVSNCNLADMWRLDTLGISNEENKTKADLEEETQKHFLKTVKRDISGRFEVSLPWIVEPSLLPSNRSIAENAAYKIEKKLSAAKNREEYSEIFDFWKSNEIIEEVSEETKDRVHFLPHRPVIKETSATTKIRPVFNASAHMKNSPSLNDCLTKGPNLIEIIPRILNRFRKYRIGISSDIEKAFLQIKISETDRDFLRFFWFDKDNNLKVYRHCRVVFGLTSSPFLLVATLKYLLSEVEPFLTETAKILERSFYIDNSLTSLDSEQETKKFMKESVSILASGHFNLRCWTSNSPTVFSGEIENGSKISPVLGLDWDTETDSLMCKLDEKFKIEEPYSKRKILSIVQKIFDPIGFTAPVILIPKLVLQQTWIQKLKWDEVLPENLSKQFNKWAKDVNLLPEIKIPRWLNIESISEKRATLHVFSDASKNAYAACAFIRVETPEGIKIQLVNARSRVSPIKELTIPRLELLSCLIGARLAKTISLDLEIDIQTTFWSDSTTALSWIRREQSWGTYVHNRVLEIRTLSDVSEWRHVPGSLNPADLPSRGCSFEQLKLSKWWEGPSWLYLPDDMWPQTEDPPDEELIDGEKRKTVLTLLDKNDNVEWYKYFSSFRKLVRMIAWTLRFFNNLKNKEKNLSLDISVEEFEKAEKTIFKLIQKETFAGQTDPKIRSLRPLEDKNQILRIKTNLVNRNDTENFRYPILLPNKHPVVRRLIFEKHIENQHAGVGILMAILREDYWILKSRKTIRNVLRECAKCRRYETHRIDIEQGVPPEDRVRDASIFEVVGTDLAGPLYLSDGTKSWIVLFTCAVYRAVHLELVSSLSTENFIQALRRFIARRGRPHTIYSDNGTNFIGTSNALSNLDWNHITSEASIQKIRWKFNPPAAPWWGGWWERLIRLTKDILRKSLGRASLNYEELNTILCDCEQVINSRPITYVSEDNNDLSPLKPIMFLQELPTSGTPDLDTLDTETLNRRARYRQTIRNELRKRFRNEYLGQLRHHYKDKRNPIQLKVGDIVLLEDTSGKRINWPLAKVTQLLPGKDGIPRLGEVQTQNGIFLRPVQRLFPLEVSPSAVSSPSSRNHQVDPTPPVIIGSGRVTTNRPVHLTPPVVTRSGRVTTNRPVHLTPPVVTRSGRVIKKPDRFQS